MKLLLPLLALTLFVTACSSPKTPSRPVWASSESGYAPAETSARAPHRQVWADSEGAAPVSADHTVWGPKPQGYSPVPNATRRGLYSPSQGSGPYTAEVKERAWTRPTLTADQEAQQRREQQAIQAMQAAPAAKP